jgi:hypothetical protein
MPLISSYIFIRLNLAGCQDSRLYLAGYIKEEEFSISVYEYLRTCHL